MAALTSFDDLTALLADAKTRHAVDRSAQVIQLPVADPALPGPLTVRWYRHAPMIEIVQNMLVDTPRPRAADIARVIARLNHSSDLPGLGFDEDARRVYMRVVVPVPPGGIDADMLYQIAEAVAHAAQASRRKVADVTGA